MSPLYLYDGKLLINNAKLASNEACCCSGCDCTTCDPTLLQLSINIGGYDLTLTTENSTYCNNNGVCKVWNSGSIDNTPLPDSPLDEDRGIILCSSRIEAPIPGVTYRDSYFLATISLYCGDNEPSDIWHPYPSFVNPSSGARVRIDVTRICWTEPSTNYGSSELTYRYYFEFDECCDNGCPKGSGHLLSAKWWDYRTEEWNDSTESAIELTDDPSFDELILCNKDCWGTWDVPTVSVECSGACFTVNYHYYGCAIAYNACACCLDNYFFDEASLIAQLTDYGTGAYTDAFVSRGFTVASHFPVSVTTTNTLPAFTNEDGSACFPQDVECEASVGLTEPGGLCLLCDGVIVVDETLDPLPTSPISADASNISPLCECPLESQAEPVFGQGGESLSCVPCGGACDEENPCPAAIEGAPYVCVCIDGECHRIINGNAFP